MPDRLERKVLFMADAATSTAAGTEAQTGSQSTDQQHAAQSAAGTAQTNEQKGSSANDLDARIQSAVDRATQKLGTENKELREEIQKLKTANMTESEKHEADIAEREKAVKEREAAITIEKNRMHAITALKNAGLDDGSNTVIELIDLVMGADEKAIDKNVSSLSALVKKMVAAEVDKTFKTQGRNPGKGGSSDDEGKKKNEFVTELGKRTAETQKKARGVLDLYTGGSK